MKNSLLALLCCMSLGACDIEGFHPSTQPVVGVYELLKSESGKYYLVRRQDANKGGTGVVEGTVRQIGWNNKFILVDRKASFAGDGNGWMIVDVSNGTVVGPFTDAQLRSQAKVADIHPQPPSEVWNPLR